VFRQYLSVFIRQYLSVNIDEPVKSRSEKNLPHDNATVSAFYSNILWSECPVLIFYETIKKIFLGFSAGWVRNDAQQIQHVGLHCVPPGLAQNNSPEHYIYDICKRQ
jgi:hypothetical protein